MGKEIERVKEKIVTTDSEGKMVTQEREFVREREVIAALGEAGRAIEAADRFEKSRMKRYVMDSQGLSRKWHELSHQYGMDEALRKLYLMEVEHYPAAFMRYMHARNKMGSGKWSWELVRVDGEGVRMKLVYVHPMAEMAIGEFIKLVKEIRQKANIETARLIQEGLPINLAKRSMDEVKIGTTVGKILLGMEVWIGWMSEQGSWYWKDVEEVMMEAGMY